MELLYLCESSESTWTLPYFQDLLGAIEEAFSLQRAEARKTSAQTKVAGFVKEALEFAYQSKSLVVVLGREGVGKTAVAESWQKENPEKARFVSLTAGTTEKLFIAELACALGCGSEPKDDTNTRKLAIRDTLRNRDLTLIIDEAHCLMGLSEKASIKRLEYIRTEFVNQGVPVVLLLTPQFMARLNDLESKSSFNLNQLRRRVAKWADLPDRPSREDIATLCKFLIPDASKTVIDLLTNLGLQSEYPFSTVGSALREVRDLQRKRGVVKLTEELVKEAVGHALYTSGRLAETAPVARGKSRRSKANGLAQPVSEPSLHELCTDRATDVPTGCTPGELSNFQHPRSRSESPASVI